MMCGKKRKIMERYLIDESGIIVRANDKVKAANDAENMLEVV